MQPAPNDRRHRSLDEWVSYICESEMPIFAHTARNIASASKELETPTAELAEFILQDSSMTARVLKLANSVYYNPNATPINTISRAIFLLGFDVVRTIALSIAVIDPLLKSTKHQYLLKELARSFHAAVQAKSLAHMRGMKDAEEIFIAALLFRIGHMAFWSFSRGLADALDSAYREWDMEDEAEAAVLGFPLVQLSGALHKQWRLSEIVSRALSADSENSAAATDITQAFELVMALEEGWGSTRTHDALTNIAERLDTPREQLQQTIKQNARLAARTACEYGADKAGSLIKLPSDEPTLGERNDRPPEPGNSPMLLQMNVLRELSSMLSEGVDINAVLGTVLEGVFRALVMDRTVLALITPDQRLQAKYVFGDDGERLKRCFDFELHGEQHLFTYLLKQRRPGWYHAHAEPPLKGLMTPALRKCLGASEFYAMPLWIGQQGKGLIYADRKTTGGSLDEQDFRTFIHFCEHANIAFELLSRQQGR